MVIIFPTESVNGNEWCHTPDS